MRSIPHFLASIALLSTVIPAPAAELFPFVLPWDDATPSATDISSWIEKPAGRHGFVTVKDGHLFAGAKRWRIFGVNMAFGGNFPSREDAEKIAARLAKFGINCVRFHHMDMQSAPGGIFTKDMKTLDPGQLDRLDWFIAKLKEHGIYTNLNLHVSRTYPDRPKSEKQGNENYDKGVDNYSAAMIALQKDFARDLLTHVNPYTGKAYIDEPAVALIEINNENALLFSWWTGALDKAAQPYRDELSTLWKQWLATKYPQAEARRAAWAVGVQEAGPELLNNGSFARKLEGWSLERHAGAEAAAEIRLMEEDGNPNPPSGNGAPHVRIAVSKPGTEPWHVQLVQSGLKLEAGRSYTLTFKARADAPQATRASASQAHAPWSVFESKEIKLTPEWQSHRFTFKAKENESARIALTSLGAQTGTFDFADVHLAASAISGEPVLGPGGEPVAFTKEESAARTEAAQRDWFQFLWHLEERYWIGMYRFLKDELKAKSLVLGTQLFWSPFPIQAQLDVVDAHAYWQHPHFPNKQWDMNDWSVKNVPMAGDPKGGVLANLALQRVAGKPYIVSEYNHSAPNTFSAETFPLVCAFAAMQDWDGVFAFAYSHRANDWAKGYFPSFFDIDQHPVKMATLPGALATFIRGDVSEAESASFAPVSIDRAMEQARKGGPRIGAEHFGVAKEAAMQTRVGVLPAAAGSNTTVAEKSNGGSAGFLWDTARGAVTVNTARSKAFIGRAPAGQPIALGDISLIPGETAQQWACIQLTALEGADFKSARRILVTATGLAENTEMQWKNAEKTTVGRDWGKAPSLVEGIAATIQLPASAKLKAWALDERGQRRAPVPFENGTLRIGPEHRTLWYELAAE